MPNPKRRHSSSRRGKRRAHDALDTQMMVRCKNCGAYALPHRVCRECGFYNGRQVIAVRTIGAGDVE
jgi:large subunit ribosomal protein L32